ncbi:flagellar associated protein [Nocardiopsis sp. HUAS JQ3]|uniref:flagellar associated protein n=1 Tax=Nocardiopsis sp. HUAS JQ3 TaxID=3061629 RepID=UPI0023A9D454|nr:flagellar associated protein [Nocardiopsis sp. HUAS JQ3]WDZ91605.1 flagellar associated protein [Nocardiopsis sp. HUAS JQ3]
MPRTSRTARATRAVAAVCPEAPSLLLLPLVVGALLVGLWLLGAAPAAADSGTDVGGSRSLLDGGPLTGGRLSDGFSGTSGNPEHASAESTAPHHGLRDRVSSGRAALDASSLGLEGSGRLGEVVPEGVGKVAEPVASTLGTVHQRIEHGAERTAAETAAVLPEAAWPVAGMGEGARNLVGGLDRDGRSDAGLLAPVAPSVHEPAPERDGDDSAAGPRERAKGEDTVPGAGHGTVYGHGSVIPIRAAVASVGADAGERPDTAAPAPGSSAHQLTAGSTAPAGGGVPVPAVAGYLTAAPVTVPSADAVLLAARALLTVPGGPSDDPTVSPD